MAPKPAADGADAAGGLSPGGSYDGGAIPPEEDVRRLSGDTEILDGLFSNVFASYPSNFRSSVERYLDRCDLSITVLKV